MIGYTREKERLRKQAERNVKSYDSKLRNRAAGELRPNDLRKSPRGACPTRMTAKVIPPPPTCTGLCMLERKTGETDVEQVRVSAAAKWSAPGLTQARLESDFFIKKSACISKRSFWSG